MWILKKKTDKDLLAAHQSYFHCGIFHYFWLACFRKKKKRKKKKKRPSTIHFPWMGTMGCYYMVSSVSRQDKPNTVL